ncbi:fungal-specific transcription factor [Aspergillus heteromorphus CBS 117.55]|uniref:Fungal-specific transcription factor n=1 Tax=Aspergillus heteromorphus CBS 117.55 TaxID=1448321 RepID=A0A317VIL5_9EURO|nr:fungal-specific transcription factor [Aspergillus heteromorphus CBS 117.55]PWY73037.1 fungal-specific transcription factor [Aspergillus heteromorphus CBS 117.55]
MELAWLAETPQTRHRKRALRACPRCQLKKKRCHHLDPETTPNRAQTRPVSRSYRQPRPSPPSILNRPADDAVVQDARPSPTSPATEGGMSRPERFLGAMNPESLMREKIDAATNANLLRDRIGLWITSPDTSQNGPRPRDAQSAAISSSAGLQAISYQLQRKLESAMNAFTNLPASTRHHLIPIYLSKINHMLPIVDQDIFLADHSEGPVSPFLERAICLVAAKDRAALPYLRLVEDGPVLSSREFCSNIYRGLSVVINEGLETDRITRIRVMALMSLHCEDSDGTETASMHLCHAIHQAQTVGLHLIRPRNTDQDLSGLFWCLWTLDKIHACIGGRPVLLLDSDIGVKKPAAVRNNQPRPRTAFEIWFAISDLLSDVIHLYRPAADPDSRWEKGFPNFHEIVGGNVNQYLDIATLGFLELFYNSVGILFARNRSVEHSETSNSSHIRQDLAAIRIQSIVATECPDGLLPLPIVPYALGLSMGVSYQQYRSTNLVTSLTRCKTDLEARCALMETISPYWSSADTMARLGRKALHHIQERTPGYRPSLSTPMHAMQPRGPISAPSSDLSQSNRAPFNNSAPADPMQGYHAEDVAESEQAHLQGISLDGFADIDTLFGDFLDLSLPHGFLDSAIFTPEPAGQGQP